MAIEPQSGADSMTAVIKDKECQERVESLINSIDLIFKLPQITIENARALWQSLKQKEGVE